MKTVDLSDAELTAFSGEHLLYEFRLFLWTRNELGRPLPDVMRSALIESFSIHLRNLIDFFFSPRTKEDDVIAADFCPGWKETVSSSLAAAKERANKEISHLTLGRKNELDASKTWDIGALFEEVNNVAKVFACRASPTKLSAEVTTWLDTPRAYAIAIVGAMATTNTTSFTITTTSAVSPVGATGPKTPAS